MFGIILLNTKIVSSRAHFDRRQVTLCILKPEEFISDLFGRPFEQA